MTSKPLRAAIIGMGGFARSHQGAVRTLEAAGDVRLVATCDPQPGQFAAQQEAWDFAGRDVRVYTDYVEMLDAHRDALDLVTVPTPLPLHAPMHRACVERGLACYLEKPPTLFWAELDEMLQVERRARRATQVGFNFIVEEPRQALKRRVLEGEFGRLLRVGFTGHWPRATSYYARAPWAGRLFLNGQLVLDSCTGNAMAHYIHNLLFWCGRDGVLSWGEVREVEAELYRAHAIESFDTCFARARCEGDIEVRVAATHAGIGSSTHREWIDCEKATITYITGAQGYSIRWQDGREESGAADPRHLLTENLRYYARYLRGEAARPLTRLEDSRPFVHFNNLLFVAAGGIAAVGEEYLRRTATTEGDGAWVAINGIRDMMEEFGHAGRFPGGGGAAWGQPGGRATAAEVSQLLPVVQRIRAEP